MSDSTNTSQRNQGPAVSLRIKFAIFLSLIVIVTCSGLSYFFLRNQAGIMASELDRLGSVLVKNLAHNSRYAVFIEDEEAISRLIDGVMKVDQVVYVVVTGAKGQTLAADSKGRLTGGGLERDPEVALYPDPSRTFALLTSAPTEPVITSFSMGGITVEETVSRGKAGTVPIKKTVGSESVRDFALTVVRSALPETQSLELLQQQEEEGFAEEGPGSTRKVYGIVRVGLSTAPMDRALANAIWKAVWLTITIILIGIVSTFILVTRVTQPLRRLMAVAQRIAEGDLSAGVPATTADEVGQLTRSFNQMTDGLKKRDEELSKAYHTLEEKVRERTGELEAANERLQEMDRLKSDFFANISHELRTPLTLIVGTFNTLLSRPPTALNEELLQAGLRNTSRLLFLINELLDLAKFESGRADMRKRCIDLRALIRRVAANFESSPGRRIHLRGMSRPVLAEVDPRGMQSVVYNLLSNALKFSNPQEGQAWIQLREHDDTVELEVEDNGIGIPAEQLDRIFDRFTQVDSSAARRYAGSGIGLAHVKEIVTHHGGRIAVESEVGRGSVFTITLPRGDARPEDLAPLEEQEESFILPVEAPAAAVSQWGGTLAPEDPEAPLVLVADDNADMRSYLGSILGRQYRILQARDGVEALEQARSQRPDLIVTDVMMPRMSGYDLLRALKSDRDLRTVPVIFVTAMAETEAQIESLEAGADDYIAKPFNESVVLARVGNVLKARLQQRAIANLQQEKLLRFLPPQIGKLVVSGTADEFLKGHRAEVTALFVDLRGFTAFTETAEPEDSTALLHEYHAEMGRLIADSGGTLTHLAGDSMMVLFNDPVPVDTHGEIAVRLALTMQDRIGELKQGWAQRGFQLGAGVGIATGYATVGIIGLEGRQEYTAIGSVINLAARLCAEAQDGQILVSERLLALIEGRVEVERAGDLPLKGFQNPIATYNVTGLRRRQGEPGAGRDS